MSSWGSGNYRQSAPLLCEVASHVKTTQCHSGHYKKNRSIIHRPCFLSPIRVQFYAGGGKAITCLTFDDPIFSGTNGDWVSNTGVLVDSSNCVSGNCSYFPGVNSRLEVPRFQAAFDAWSQFSLSFWMRNMEDGPSGIITNGGCIHSPGAPPSLYVHGDWSGKLTVGMTTKLGLAKSVTVYTVSRNSRLVSHVYGDKRKE